MRLKNIFLVTLFSVLLTNFATASEFVFKYNLVMKESKKNFEDTYDALINAINEKKIKIFAQYDHLLNAEEVNLKMDANKVVVFGNPAVGTYLMQENPDISIELPLRISVVQNENKVLVSFVNVKHLQKTYNLKNEKVVENIRKLMMNLVDIATSK